MFEASYHYKQCPRNTHATNFFFGVALDKPECFPGVAWELTPERGPPVEGQGLFHAVAGFYIHPVDLYWK